MLSLSHFVSRAAKINAGGIATICGEQRRSWAEVLNRVQCAAAMLQDLGLAANERVAILSPNSDTYLEYLFSVNWAGGVIVPINTRLAGPEILFWLEDSDAKILVVADPFVDLVNSLREQMPGIEHFVYIGEGETPEGFVSHEERLKALQPVADAGRGDEDLAALFYTGGTTGRSKGVMITHAGLYINILQWISAIGVTQEDRFLVIPPMFHAAGGETVWRWLRWRPPPISCPNLTW